MMNASIKLTNKELEVCKFILKFYAENGYTPTYRDIMKGIYYNSINGVKEIIDRLVDKNYFQKCGHRGLKINNIELWEMLMEYKFLMQK